ncbi:response regulator receiver protein [Gloeocapsa sp. PCC 7428]|uniref:response regulator n=1 Tax=Gloeocapsa sp. PCC 7428 TaxID=1173026 RepID=UPI0002A5F9B6|nr:response regulator [Gloeocapsa sp. PCC 7428]AFZ30646.1 response regulator receiver protein [Gloeocapsa sp. PCC 7428]
MAKKRILVIDDEDDILQLIQTCLEIMGGWQVLIAHSGREGLHLAQDRQPDAILLDVMMADEDGLTTLKKLQSSTITNTIPVILLTAKGRFIKQNFIELGVKGILNKPFNPLKLAEQVEAALS